MSFSPADREEENTEDNIQALDSQLGKKELDCYMKISSYQELVLKEMEVGELQLENEVLEHTYKVRM